MTNDVNQETDNKTIGVTPKSTKAWHNLEHDAPTRKLLVLVIEHSFRQSQRDPDMDMIDKELPLMARKVENSLYNTANSLEEFKDPGSLGFLALPSELWDRSNLYATTPKESTATATAAAEKKAKAALKNKEKKDRKKRKREKECSRESTSCSRRSKIKSWRGSGG